MRNIFLRLFALAIVVAMGLLAIAHAQRSAADPFTQPVAGDAPPNPLRITVPDVSSNATPQQNPAAAVDNPLRPSQDNSNPPLATQDNPLQGAPADPYKPVPMDRLRHRPNNDLAVRPVADNEPANGPALLNPTPSNFAPTNPQPLNAPMASGGEPRLLSPNQAPANPAPDLPATPPFGDNRSFAAGATPNVTMPTGTMPTPMPATARDGFRNDTAFRGALPAGKPMSDENAMASAASDTAGSEGSGQPGERSLEGPQTPQLMVQKLAPPELQVGRPVVLRTVVRNTGPAPAIDVEIHDMIPKGARLLGTAPRAQQGPRGELTWSIAAIKPGEESIVEMQVMPVDEGEIGSVATVQFCASASARSRCTRPRLVVETVGTPQVLMGDDASLTFTVSNPGTGMATGVVLQERIPAGAQHPAGKELEYTVGDLRPGESRKLELRLKAIQAGTISNVIVARADAGLKAEHRFAVHVVAPRLEVAMSGPKHRYLEREATYQVSVTNPGTAPAERIQLVAYLPPGLKFVNANNAGHYDEASRAVSWRLDELPVNAQGSVELVTLPIEPGQQSIKLRGTAERGLAVEKEHPVIVEGLASVSFQMAHTRDPIEIGGETSYEINVVNQGSKASTNVRLAVSLPPQLKPLAAEGPARYSISNNQVVFESLPQLAAKSVVTYRVRAKGIQAGDLRVRCQLMTDEMQAPVSKEDSTRVYGDE